MYEVPGAGDDVFGALRSMYCTVSSEDEAEEDADAAGPETETETVDSGAQQKDPSKAKSKNQLAVEASRKGFRATWEGLFPWAVCSHPTIVCGDFLLSSDQAVWQCEACSDIAISSGGHLAPNDLLSTTGALH